MMAVPQHLDLGVFTPGGATDSARSKLQEAVQVGAAQALICSGCGAWLTYGVAVVCRMALSKAWHFVRAWYVGSCSTASFEARTYMLCLTGHTSTGVRRSA